LWQKEKLAELAVGYSLLLVIYPTGFAHQKHAPLGLNMNNPG
jgi:hypothetical protein